MSDKLKDERWQRPYEQRIAKTARTDQPAFIETDGQKCDTQFSRGE
jgi:hypothetical protein